MSIYYKHDAYEHLKIGMEIKVYVGYPETENEKRKKGIITKIDRFCPGKCNDCYSCPGLISIDNDKSTCYGYEHRTGIIYAKDQEFIEESEFVL